MPDLIAQGQQRQHRWRRPLPVGQPIVLGRSCGNWSAPWDDRISRKHAQLVWQNGKLLVDAVPSARNPIFYHGRAVDRFSLEPGGHFVIGETTFTLAEEHVTISVNAPQPVTEQTFSTGYLRSVRFRDADQRIEVLSRLPEVIAAASSDAELFVRVVNVLLTGVPQATSAALVIARTDDGAIETEVLHWDRSAVSGTDFSPSHRLICEAIRRRESVVHIWSGPPKRPANFTASEDVDWAFCTPVPGEACEGWGLYVAGSGAAVAHDAQRRPTDPQDLRDDLKFAELAAATLSSLRQVRQLERRQAALGQFFSPPVMAALANGDPDDILAPREVDVTVLFCDLRGFSLRSEQSAGDLPGLLRRVSDALGVLTRHILHEGGVVGDFHGDAAMGFWGWPLPQEDAAERACRVALAIRREFAAASCQADRPLADFRVGLGIASGPAVAGKIGTTDQVKVTVFGPVVNLASRLEGMTKLLRAPILLDQATATLVRQRIPRGVARTRRLAVVRPYGMESAIEVSELVPPEHEYPGLADDAIESYEAALDALLAGDWSKAWELLHHVPALDQAKDFLTVFIAQHNRLPPKDWNGVIPLSSK